VENVAAAVARGYLALYAAQPRDPCDFLADYLLEAGVVEEKRAEAAAALRFRATLARLAEREAREEEDLHRRSRAALDEAASVGSRRSKHRGVPKY